MDDRERRMIEDIRRYRAERPRFGHRRLRALLRADGWRVSKETVRRICREEGLKMPPIKPKRRVPRSGRKPGLTASGKDRPPGTPPHPHPRHRPQPPMPRGRGRAFPRPSGAIGAGRDGQLVYGCVFGCGAG